MKNTIIISFLIFSTIYLIACKKVQTVSEKGGGSLNCQCPVFVKNVLGITTGTADAKDWGITYNIPNYERVSTPQIPDIIVMDGGFSWANRTYGHIGFVKKVIHNKDGTLNILVHGANQVGLNNAYYECGCDNVWDPEVKNISATDIKTGRIRFYRSKTSTVACSTFSLQFSTNSSAVTDSIFWQDNPPSSGW